jgi:hypothetical protein
MASTIARPPRKDGLADILSRGASLALAPRAPAPVRKRAAIPCLIPSRIVVLRWVKRKSRMPFVNYGYEHARLCQRIDENARRLASYSLLRFRLYI